MFKVKPTAWWVNSSGPGDSHSKLCRVRWCGQWPRMAGEDLQAPPPPGTFHCPCELSRWCLSGLRFLHNQFMTTMESFEGEKTHSPSPVRFSFWICDSAQDDVFNLFLPLWTQIGKVFSQLDWRLRSGYLQVKGGHWGGKEKKRSNVSPPSGERHP